MSDGNEPPDSPTRIAPSILRTRRERRPKQVTVLPAAAPDELLDAVALEITRLVRESPLDLARAIGHLVVERLHAGSLAEWRRYGEKNASFRGLATRLEAAGLPLGVSLLRRAVSLVELEGRLDVLTWKHLSIGDIRLAFPLPEDEQLVVLTKADDERWTVVKMEREIRAMRKGTSDGGKRPNGRPPDPAFQRFARHVDKLLLEPDRWFGDFDRIVELDPEERKKMRGNLVALAQRCAELTERLGNDD